GKAELLIVVDKALRVGDRHLGFVAIIVRDQIELAAMNTASGIRLMERRQYAVPHSNSERGCLPLQGGGLAKDDPVIEDARISTGGQDPKQIQCDDDGQREHQLENQDSHERSSFSRAAKLLAVRGCRNWVH